MWRTLVIVHRYLGVAVGALMVSSFGMPALAGAAANLSRTGPAVAIGTGADTAVTGPGSRTEARAGTTVITTVDG